MTFEQKLCGVMLLFWVGIFGDLTARGADSLFGQYFVWLVAVVS